MIEKDTFGILNDIIKNDEDFLLACENSPISIDNFIASVLRFFIKISKPKNIIELGALHGRSAILMSRFLENTTVHSIENNLENYQIAENNIIKHSLENRVKLYFGDCQQILNSEKMKNLKADMMFIDANKLKYDYYLNWACEFLSSKAIIIIDNIFIHRVLEKYQNSDCVMYKNMESFLRKIQDTEKFNTMIIPYQRDGLAVVMRK